MYKQMCIFLFVVVGALMSPCAWAQGWISVINDEMSEAGGFCFDLLPKPSAETDVTCVSSSQDASCCNGGNGWNFKPTTELKCGSLMGSEPTDDFPVTVTCSAEGYSDGVFILGPPDATDSDTPEHTLTDPPMNAPSVPEDTSTDPPLNVSTNPPTDAPTGLPTTSDDGTLKRKTSITVISVLAALFLVASMY